MTEKLEWTDIHRELKGFYSDLDRLQTRLFTQHAKAISLMHEVKQLADDIKRRIGEQEASDDAKDYT